MIDERRARERGRDEAAGVREFLEQGDRVREEVAELGGVARRTVELWRRELRQRLVRRPYGTLAVATGLGYVLGAGLPGPLVRSILGVGGRIALERLVSGVVNPTERS